MNTECECETNSGTVAFAVCFCIAVISIAVVVTYWIHKHQLPCLEQLRKFSFLRSKSKQSSDERNDDPYFALRKRADADHIYSVTNVGAEGQERNYITHTDL